MMHELVPSVNILPGDILFTYNVFVVAVIEKRPCRALQKGIVTVMLSNGTTLSLRAADSYWIVRNEVSE